MSLAAMFLMQEIISPPAKLYFTLESTKIEEEASKVSQNSAGLKC